MAASTVIPANFFGVITLDGVQYIERPQLFAMDVEITEPYQVLTNQRLTFLGVSDFLLKGLKRDIIYQGRSTAQVRFRFRMGNMEGSTWYFSGGLGIVNDRVFDQLCFGNAQFPYPVIPPIPFHASDNLTFEVEDATGIVPYTICMAFEGSYLIPVQGSG